MGFVDDAGHPGRFDEVERTVLVDAAHVRDERDVELATGDRTGREHGDRFVGETGEARPQHVAHAFGHRCARSLDRRACLRPAGGGRARRRRTGCPRCGRAASPRARDRRRPRRLRRRSRRPRRPSGPGSASRSRSAVRASVASVFASGGVRASASRNVPTSSTGDCCNAETANSNSRSELWSAQCRSSSTMTIGCCAERLLRTDATASKNRNRADSASGASSTTVTKRA